MSDAFGIRVSDARVDFAAVMDHVHDVIDQIARYEDDAHLGAAGVAVRRGRAALVDARTLQLGDPAARGRQAAADTTRSRAALMIP